MLDRDWTLGRQFQENSRRIGTNAAFWAEARVVKAVLARRTYQPRDTFNVPQIPIMEICLEIPDCPPGQLVWDSLSFFGPGQTNASNGGYPFKYHFCLWCNCEIREGYSRLVHQRQSPECKVRVRSVLGYEGRRDVVYWTTCIKHMMDARTALGFTPTWDTVTQVHVTAWYYSTDLGGVSGAGVPIAVPPPPYSSLVPSYLEVQPLQEVCQES